MFRNGTQTRFKKNAGNTAWIYDDNIVKPQAYYTYVEETLSYQCNKTRVAAPGWALDAAQTLTFSGYELYYVNGNKSTFRILNTVPEKVWCYSVSGGANPNTEGANDQGDWNYNKIVSMTFKSWEKTSTNVMTV